MFSGRQLSNSRYQMDCLDGLRGMAALIVFLSHTSNHSQFFLPHFNFTGIGKSGVWLFFVLSAFLLTFPFVEKREMAFKKGFLLNYALRRFLRIYPLYFCYLLLALVTSLVLYRLMHETKPFGIPYYLSPKGFVAQAFFQEGFGVTWSILAEFRYYFVLPLIALAFTLVFKRKITPSLILTIGLILLSEYFWPQSEAKNNDPGLGQYLPIFLLGSFLALLHHHWRKNAWDKNRNIQFLLEALGWLSVIVVIMLIPSVTAFITGTKLDPNEFHKQYVVYGMLWAVLLFACINGYGLLRRFFEIRFLRYIGFISFSFYLLQDIFIEHMPFIFGRIPFIAWVTLLASVVASHVTYLVIEKPFSRIKYAAESKPAAQ